MKLKDCRLKAAYLALRQTERDTINKKFTKLWNNEKLSRDQIYALAWLIIEKQYNGG